MADYVPIFTPGQALTLQASAAVTGGQLLVITGPGTVGPAGAASSAWIGVAAFDVPVNGRVTVHKRGVQELTATGAITAGDRVIPAAGGTVATLGVSTDYSQIVGVALTTAAGGAKVQVDFVR